MLKKIFHINKSIKQKQEVRINILTRTSNRPIGFQNCRKSIIKQTYKNVRHLVSYENKADLAYIDFFNDIVKIKVKKYEGEVLFNPEGHLHAPYNLYCNMMLNIVEDGWVLFLDDDDHLLHNKVIEEIVAEIKKADDDTLFIWQMRFPNGKLLPTSKHFKSKQIAFNYIGSPCFIFHSKYKNIAQWDEWKASDYRVIKALYEKIPKKKWIEKVYIQINNFGDFGNGNDIVQDVTNKIFFKKTWFWLLIPKYHTKLNDIYIFQTKTYRQYWKRGIKKLQRIFK